MVKVTRTSPLTGKETTLELDLTNDQLERLLNRRRNGELIQNIVPHLSPDEREFLLTGYTKEDWATMFPPEEEEDADETEHYNAQSEEEPK